MSEVWDDCADRVRAIPVSGQLFRLVESQEQVATSTLVDDLAEQSLLETLIEAVKPPLRAGTERLDYLLASPFRYPPLRHGSRFGSRLEPSLFYGSRTLAGVLSEAAYYRFLFWSGMAEPPPGGSLLTQHTLMRARYRGERGLRLQEPPCDAHEARLTDRRDYRATQALGRALRAAGIQAFEYVSARAPGREINVALFDPAALAVRRPLERSPWLCQTRADAVTFWSRGDPAPRRCALDDFLVEGRLPRAAE
jgi:hypothetical protein